MLTKRLQVLEMAILFCKKKETAFWFEVCKLRFLFSSNQFQTIIWNWILRVLREVCLLILRSKQKLTRIFATLKIWKSLKVEDQAKINVKLSETLYIFDVSQNWSKYWGVFLHFGKFPNGCFHFLKSSIKQFPRLKQKKGSVSKTWRKIIKSYKKAPGVDISKTQIKSLSFFTKALKFLAPMNTFLSSFWANEMRREEKKTATYWWDLNGNCTIFIGIHKCFGNFMITKSPCVILGISRISWVFRTS